MNNIKLLLAICTFLSISSLESAASSALMKAAEYTRATSIKPVNIQIIEEVPNNKVVAISRNGNHILSFNAQLLADHDFSGIIEFGKGTNAAYIEAAKALFNDLNNHQINVLVKALNSNYHIDSAKDFVDNLDQNDYGWLTTKANFANISNIYNTITKKLAGYPNFALSLYNISKINKDVGHDVSDEIDMQSVNRAIANRISDSCRYIFDNKSLNITFNTNNSKALITTLKRVILVDMQNPKQQTILYTLTQQLDSSWIRSATFNTNNTQVLINTGNRVILVDAQNHQQTVLYTRNYQLDGHVIKSAIFSTTNTQVLISTENRIILVDIQNPNLQTVLYTINPQLDGNIAQAHIQSAIFNIDNSKALISTFNRAILIDIQNPNQQTILYTIDPALDIFIKSAIFSDDNSKALIVTKYRVILVDIQNPNQQIILYTLDQALDDTPIKSAIFSDDNSKVLISTYDSVILIDTQNPNQQTVLYTRLDGSYIGKVIFNTDNSQVLITTNDRVILVSTQNPDQQTILYARNDLLDGKSIKSAMFNAVNNQVLIATTNRVILCQISYLNLLKSLNIHQKVFLINVSKAWEYNEPYIIQSKEEREIYESLPEELKKPELFEIAKE